MPSERQRKKTKEDTWGTDELSKSIKDAMREDNLHKQQSHEKEKHRDRERTKDREHRKERSHKDKDSDKDRQKRREKHKSDGVSDPKDRGKDVREGDESQGRSHRQRKDKDRRHTDEVTIEKKKRGDGKSSSDRERHRGDREKRSHDKGRDGERRHREEREKRSDDKEGNGEERHREDREKHSHDKERRSDRDTGKESEEREKRREGRRRKEDRNNRDRDHKKDDGDDRRENRKDGKKRKQKRQEDKDDTDNRQRSEEKGSKYNKNEEYTEDEIPVVDNSAEDDKNQDDGHSYEDDFEDYEDDFEDEDGNDDETEEEQDNNVMTRENNAELDAVRRAMATENQAMHSGWKDKGASSSATSSRSVTAKSSRSFVNFVAAKQRQINSHVWQHSRKRGKELMELIELDVVGYDLFDMAPVKEYELYIKSFGRSNTKQAFVQYNEDNLERDVQTDPIENREMWTQHPAEGVSAFGGAGEKRNEGETINEADSLRLTKFLQKAGQAISILQEEESGENAKSVLQSNQRSILFSEGYTELNSQLSFLEGRHVVHAQFHPVQTNFLLTVHSTSKKGGETNLLERGVLCVWNVNEPSRPQKVLSCKSTPVCCCFSPTKSTLAFAGTVDGSIVVWDLREPSSMHISQVLEGLTIRVPTFSTDGIQNQENHHSAVVTVQPIVAVEESLKASMQGSHVRDSMAGLSFQLASLEEKGTIHFSVVIEIDKPDLAGSESDLGLVPYGKIKLIKTSSVSLSMSPSSGLGGDIMKTFHMQLSPLDPNQFFVATDSGLVIHGARHGGKVPPRIYSDRLDVPVDIVQVDFSPFGLQIFLVACSDGNIRLYNTMSDLPIITWSNSTSGVGIKCIQWSRSRPSVFYVMDKASKVYVWELLENDGAPVKTEQFTHASLTFLTLSNDRVTAGRAQPGKRLEMLITDAKGAMDVHRINKTFSTACPNELDGVTNLLNNII